MSITALSEATGITRARLSDIGRGLNHPSWSNLHRIAFALGLEVRLVADPTLQTSEVEHG
jgi:transcriptional regulator with XRE-family HTH domain